MGMPMTIAGAPAWLRSIAPAPSVPRSRCAPSTGPSDQLELTSCAGASSGRITLDTVHSRYVKDPSFVNGGQPIGTQRYVAFGDLRQLYLKPFSVATSPDGGPGLRFGKGEIAVRIAGLAPDLDGLWAPQIVVQGDRVQLFYCAGRMPPGGIDWPSFRLHMAEMPLSTFESEARSGQSVTFSDRRALFPDQTTFGGAGRRFAMIDPDLYRTPQGQAFLLYTVVEPASPGHPWQEFVRSRQVSSDDPMRALGPDTPLIDGWSHGPHRGVVEAPSLVTVAGRTMLFVSSRAGDRDQRVLEASVDPRLGTRVPDSALHPVLEPGNAPWEARSVGSTDELEAGGRVFLLYQGMDARHRFSLGWTTVPGGTTPKGRWNSGG